MEPMPTGTNPAPEKRPWHVPRLEVIGEAEKDTRSGPSFNPDGSGSS